MTTRRDVTRGLLASPFILSGISRSHAQDSYPNRAIQMVVGFPPGQSSDIGARVMAKGMTDILKQSVFVENKPGAATIIGHQFLKAAAPDGYTIGYSSTASMAINPTLYKNLPYDPQKDFEAITQVSFTPLFLVTGKDTPVHTYKEMLAYVKANPGKVNYGSGGSGLTNHITMELLKRDAGIDMMHIPYKGAPPMIADLMAGRVQFAFETSTAIFSFVEAGNIRLLGAASLERSPAAPNVPTLHEQGLANFESGTWGVILAPKGTPKPIITKLNEAVIQTLKTPESIAFYKQNGATPRGTTPEECAAFMKGERDKWAPVIISSGAQVD